MSLDERLDFEEGKIVASELFIKTCCNCRHWNNLITHKVDFCHKCINNPRISIKFKCGYSIEELYDYQIPLKLYKEHYLDEKSCLSGKL